jgi:hypothetical protein
VAFTGHVLGFMGARVIKEDKEEAAVSDTRVSAA